MQNMLPKQTNEYQNTNALANTTTNSNTNKDWHKNKNSPKIKYGLNTITHKIPQIKIQ